MHSALLNRVLLDGLAQVDLLSCIALSYRTCHDLDDFIFDHVIGLSLMTSFLRQHAYALFHDNYKKHFSDREIVLLTFAVQRLQAQRDADSLFDSLGEYLGPLISRTPLELFFKTGKNLADFSFTPKASNTKRKPYIITASAIRFEFECLLSTPWMYATWFLRANRDNVSSVEAVNSIDPHPILNGQFLFSRRYTDMFITALSRTNSGIKVWHKSSRIGPPEALVVPENVDGICAAFHADHHRSLLTSQKKSCLLAFIDSGLIDLRRTPEANFKAVFEMTSWKDMWTDAELGRLIALGLSQYGPAGYIGELIEDSFTSKFHTYLWLFLGAHYLFHPWTPRDQTFYARDENKACCISEDTAGIEKDYLNEAIQSFNVDERVLLVTRAVRMAPEFGVCRDLGANLFNYVVLQGQEHEVNAVFDTLVREICSSRMQYLFEHAIGLAIANADRLPSPEIDTRQLKDKLLIQRGELYQLLDGRQPIVRRDEFYERDETEKGESDNEMGYNSEME
jgi:hypothetical protein